MAAYAAAEVLGMGAAASAAAVSTAFVGEPQSFGAGVVAWGISTAGGAVETAMIGILTFLALRRWLPNLPARRWIVATMCVGMLGWAIGSLPSTIIAGAMGTATGTDSAEVASELPPVALLLAIVGAAGLAAGAIIGAVQAWALHEVVAHPRRWILPNAVGWAIGLIVIMTGAGTIPAGVAVATVVAWGAVTGLLAGAFVGLATGCAIPSLDDRGPRAKKLSNRFVLTVLRSPVHHLLSGSLVEMDLQGTVTRRWFALPVQAAATPEGWIVMPALWQTKQWWHSISHLTPAFVLAKGHRIPVLGSVLEGDSPDYPDAARRYKLRWPKSILADGQPLVTLLKVPADGTAATTTSPVPQS